MEINRVADELFSYLMEKVGGEKFEILAKVAIGEEYGEEFTPLGGIHDGGADGLISSYVQEGKKPQRISETS